MTWVSSNFVELLERQTFQKRSGSGLSERARAVTDFLFHLRTCLHLLLKERKRQETTLAQSVSRLFNRFITPFSFIWAIVFLAFHAFGFFKRIFGIENFKSYFTSNFKSSNLRRLLKEEKKAQGNALPTFHHAIFLPWALQIFILAFHA